MAKTGLDKDTVVSKAAELANKVGMERITLKMLADDLGVKPPSLYNHIKGLDDLKRELMLYGWKQIQRSVLRSVAGVSGYDAVKAMCYAFYDYATANPGLFDAMLWYNKFQDDETTEATSELLSVIFKIASSLHISEDLCFHLIRTFRGFLEGFFLLANNGSFGHSLPVRESFEISLNILVEGMKALAAEEKPKSTEQTGSAGDTHEKQR